jgi:hypothetical protein
MRDASGAASTSGAASARGWLRADLPLAGLLRLPGRSRIDVEAQLALEGVAIPVAQATGRRVVGSAHAHSLMPVPHTLSPSKAPRP